MRRLPVVVSIALLFRGQDSFTLLCGVLLSAQTTDAQVRRLFGSLFSLLGNMFA